MMYNTASDVVTGLERSPGLGAKMPELPEETQEKPVYETPVVVDLDAIQRGEGGVVVGCMNGSGDAGGCLVGGGFI
jgi:hypothetical protein